MRARPLEKVLSTVPARARRDLLVASIVFGACCGLAFACGGTSGMPEQATPPGGQAALDGGLDATVEIDAAEASTPAPDAGLFDVAIQYADQNLPEVTAPPEGGPAPRPWPDCPPFLPVDDTDTPTSLPYADHQDPSEWDGGVAVLAPDGSACASYPWLGSTAIDRCVIAGQPSGAIWLPPCNWCVDAGAAAQGTREGDQRYQICLDLYACIVGSGCATGSGAAQACLCGTESSAKCVGDPSPPGPCAAQEMAALEELPGSTGDALMHFTAVPPTTFLGVCGSTMNEVMQLGYTNHCFIDAGP
jgi:hypothetical protein